MTNLTANASLFHDKTAELGQQKFAVFLTRGERKMTSIGMKDCDHKKIVPQLLTVGLPFAVLCDTSPLTTPVSANPHTGSPEPLSLCSQQSSFQPQGGQESHRCGRSSSVGFFEQTHNFWRRCHFATDFLKWEAIKQQQNRSS